MHHSDKLTIAGQQYVLSVPIRERLRDALECIRPDGEVVSFEDRIDAGCRVWAACEQAKRRLERRGRI